MQVGLTRTELLAVIEHHANALARRINNELFGAALGGTATASDSEINIAVGRLSARLGPADRAV